MALLASPDVGIRGRPLLRTVRHAARSLAQIHRGLNESPPTEFIGSIPKWKQR
jgi:hypothetical protein